MLTLNNIDAELDIQLFDFEPEILEEVIRAYAEIMDEDINVCADQVVLDAYIDNKLTKEHISAIRRHLACCDTCRGNLASILQAHQISETHPIYRDLCELHLRAKQTEALKGVMLKRKGDMYLVSIRNAETGIWEERDAELPSFAHHEPISGEKVLVWPLKNGGAWILGEQWESLSPIPENPYPGSELGF